MNQPAYLPPYPEVVPTSALRADFNAVLKKEISLGNKDALPTIGYLRSDVLLATPSNSVEFQLKQGAANPGTAQLGVENRLKDNDAFYVRDVGVFFRSADVANGNLFPTAPIQSDLRAFANGTVLTAAPEVVEQAFQGNLSARVDSTVYIDALDLYRFKYVGDAQSGSGAAIWTADSWKGDDMFAACTPMIRMNGLGNNEWTVEFPETLPWDTVEPTQAIVLYLRGFYVQNAGSARNSK